MFDWIYNWIYSSELKSNDLTENIDDRKNNISLLEELLECRANLKHISLPIPKSNFPCTNPLFIELRKKIMDRRM